MSPRRFADFTLARTPSIARSRAPWWLLLPGVLCASAAFGATPSLTPSGAAVLRERFAALQAAPEPSPFGPLLHLQFYEANDRLRGEVYALVDHPFTRVQPALVSAEHWCQILILHLNVKYCRATGESPQVLDVGLGRKFDQQLKEAYWLKFAYRPTQVGDDFLRVVLNAPSGPMGTHNYLIAVEATPLDPRRSIVHLTYSYTYDTAARLAMKAYLATLGRAKVGFSVVGRDSSGRPKYAEGVRGAVERNIMRYYLAIEAYLGAETSPEPDRQRRRLENWFDATERHTRQLHEMERDAYLKMKEREIHRQETQPPPHRTP